MTNSFVHQNVMRRVRTIHRLKSATSGVAASVLVLIASLYLIGREVWVARVWENMPSVSNIAAFSRFFTYAFTHTHLSVQLLILFVIFATLWLLRELGRMVLIGSPRLAGA